MTVQRSTTRAALVSALLLTLTSPVGAQDVHTCDIRIVYDLPRMPTRTAESLR